MKSMVHVLLVAFAALHASGWVIADEPDPLRLLKAENKALRAQVAGLQKQIAELKAAIGKATKENAKLISAMNAAGLEFPAESTSKPSKAAAAKPSAKPLSVSDLVVLARRTTETGVTALQREAMLKGLVGKWTSLRVEVTEVTRSYDYAAKRSAAKVRVTYRSKRMMSPPSGVFPKPKKVPAVQIWAAIAMPLERASKLKKGDKINILAKIRGMNVAMASREGRVALTMSLDACARVATTAPAAKAPK